MHQWRSQDFRSEWKEKEASLKVETVHLPFHISCIKLQDFFIIQAWSPPGSGYAPDDVEPMHKQASMMKLLLFIFPEASLRERPDIT